MVQYGQKWTIVERYGANNDGDPVRYAIADGTSVSKNSALTLADNRTVTVTAFGDKLFAGVSAEEHIGGQGITSISVLTNARCLATASGALGLGAPIGLTANDMIIAAVGQASGAEIIGYTTEAASDGEADVSFRLRL